MPATVYEVSVVSRNRYGLSDNSLIKRFATGGESEFERVARIKYMIKMHWSKV